MLDTRRALSLASGQGQSLPEIDELKHLHSEGVRFRKGALVMVAGQSGTGKSTFAQWLAIKMNVPCLYIQADSSPHTAMARTTATVTGQTYDSIVDSMEESDVARDYYADQISEIRIHWSFAPTPTLESLALELDCYVEIWDRYPDLIVVDNLCDLDSGSDGYEGQKFLMEQLHALARVTDACVMVLHHCRDNPHGDKNYDQSFPPPRWWIQNKVDAKPELILTIANAEGVFRVAPVKVREAKCDPSGKRWIGLRSDLSRCSFDLASVYPQGSVCL